MLSLPYRPALNPRAASFTPEQQVPALNPLAATFIPTTKSTTKATTSVPYLIDTTELRRVTEEIMRKDDEAKLYEDILGVDGLKADIPALPTGLKLNGAHKSKSSKMNWDSEFRAPIHEHIGLEHEMQMDSLNAAEHEPHDLEPWEEEFWFVTYNGNWDLVEKIMHAIDKQGIKF